MEVFKERYTITELSKKLEVTDHTLRYYEKEFNIIVPKDDRGRRYYTPKLANLMYQIKSMRNEGLEIKAIKKILLSENIVFEPPPVVPDNKVLSLYPVQTDKNTREIEMFFEEFREQLLETVSEDIISVKDYISTEINKSKLELGACVEHNMRRIESKLEKHFKEVDESITSWRIRSKRGFIKRIFKQQ